MRAEFEDRCHVALELLHLIDDDIGLLSDEEVISELAKLKIDAAMVTGNIVKGDKKSDRSATSAKKLLELVDEKNSLDSIDGMTLEEVRCELSALGVSPNRLIHGAERRCRDQLVHRIDNAEDDEEIDGVPTGLPTRVTADQIRDSGDYEVEPAGIASEEPHGRSDQKSGGFGWIGIAVAVLIAFLFVSAGADRVPITPVGPTSLVWELVANLLSHRSLPGEAGIGLIGTGFLILIGFFLLRMFGRIAMQLLSFLGAVLIPLLLAMALALMFVAVRAGSFIF